MEITEYSHLAGIASSRLGLSVSQFYEMTPIEFNTALKDWELNRKEEMQLQVTDIRSTAVQIRWQTMFIYNANARKGKQIKDPRKLGRFDWELKMDYKKQQSHAEMKDILTKWAASFDKRPSKK